MKKFVVTEILVFGVASSLLHAAAISWSAPALITNESVIQPNVSSAFNFHNGNASTTVTANGVDVAFASTSSGAIVSNGLTVNFTSNFNTGIPVVADMWNGTVLADADFNNPIMDSFAHTGGAASITGTFVLSGLTAGTQYSVQLFASDSRNGSGARTIQYNDGQGNATAKVRQDSKPHFIGTFVADGTSQTFNAFSDTSAGSTNASAIINAMTVAVVPSAVIPEPSGAALFCLGGLTLMIRRRR